MAFAIVHGLAYVGRYRLDGKSPCWIGMMHDSAATRMAEIIGIK